MRLGVTLALLVAVLGIGGSALAQGHAAGSSVHVKVKVPPAGKQKLGSYVLRVKANTRPKIKITMPNVAKLPADLRAAAGSTKATRSGKIWTFKILVAMNNLAAAGRSPSQARQEAADVLIRVFSGREFDSERDFLDDCLTRAEQRAWDKTRHILAAFFTLGPWPSSPEEIFKHVLADEKARCP